MVNPMEDGVAYLKKLVRKYHLQLLLLFGSQAEGTQHPRSDVDIAYYSKKDLDLMDEAHMIVDLAPVVKSEQIDLVNMKTAPPLLLQAIFKNPQLLYAKDTYLFSNLSAYAFKRYVEAKPLLTMRSERLKEIIVDHKPYDI